MVSDIPAGYGKIANLFYSIRFVFITPADGGLAQWPLPGFVPTLLFLFIYLEHSLASGRHWRPSWPAAGLRSGRADTDPSSKKTCPQCLFHRSNMELHHRSRKFICGPGWLRPRTFPPTLSAFGLIYSTRKVLVSQDRRHQPPGLFELLLLLYFTFEREKKYYEKKYWLF